MKEGIKFIPILMIFCSCMVIAVFSKAQLLNDPPLDFDHINYEQGMSTGAMVDVFKDSKGFVWILTTGGINRYDGNEFKIFRCNASDTSSISNGFPTAITEDRNQIIWIACDIPHGLNAYNPVTGKFTRYHNNPAYKNQLPSSVINKLFVDDDNILWMCTEGEAVYAWDLKRDKIIHYAAESGNPSSIADNRIINGLVVPGGNILFYSAHHVYRFNKKTGQFSVYGTYTEGKLNLHKWVPGILSDGQNRVCMASDKGLHLLDSSLTLILEYPARLQQLLALCSNKFLQLTPDNRIWIDTDSGLIILDAFSKKYSVYRNDPDEPRSISRLMYRGLTYDPSGVMWIRGGSGINKVRLERECFHIIHNPEEFNRYGGPVISSVRHNYQDRAGRIFQANPKGVFVFDFASKKFSPFLPDKEARRFLLNRNVHFIFQDTTGSYWFGMDGHTLVSYQPDTRQENRWTLTDGHDFESPGFTYMQSVAQDDHQNIWFGEAFSICRYNMVSKKFRTYYIDEHNKRNTVNATPVVIKTGHGQVWFGSTGLFRYDDTRDIITAVSTGNDETGRILSASKITCAVNSDKRFLWIGTDGSGIFLLDLYTMKCRRISVTDGLPNDRIFAISKDLSGLLWVSTDGGLCRYMPSAHPLTDPVAGVFKTYVTNSIWPVQGYYGKDSTLYFKMYAYTGLLYFRPDSLKDNQFIPPVYITGFRLFNKPVTVGDSTAVLDSSIETKKRIVLRHDQNVFSFTFAALSFINPKKNKYAYRLLGFDKDWNYTDALQRYAGYTNLDPGTYIFQVKGSNEDDTWNPVPATLEIVILPAYWQTWWFRAIIVFAVAAILFIVYRYRKQQSSRMQTIRNRIASDLHDDIGSTLSSISYYSEAIRKQVKDSNPQVISLLNKMGTASENTVEAMGDIVWATNPSFDKGSDLINRMRSYATESCDLKNVQFEFDVDSQFESKKLDMETKRNLYLIFKEAVNNALKYSGCTLLQVRITGKQMRVQDNGKGFDLRKGLPGNGLRNMQQRAKEIKGTLEVRSSVNHGTLLILQF